MFLRKKKIILIVLSGALSLLSALPWHPHYDKEDHSGDIIILKRILDRKPCDTEALKNLAILHYADEQFITAEEYAHKCLKITRDRDMAYLLILSSACRGEYRVADHYLNTFLKNYMVSSEERKQLLIKKELYKRALETQSKPSVNKLDNSDSNRIFLGLDLQRNRLVGYNKSRRKVFYYNYRNRKFIYPVKIPPCLEDIDLKQIEFISFSGNRREVLLSIATGNKKSEILYRRCDSEQKKWSYPEYMPVLNTGKRNSYANFMPDGKTILFSGTCGNNDEYNIFITRKDRFGEWTNPVELTNCNTRGDEYSLFLHPDGETLYFSTNGRPGLGGFDLFAGRIKKNDTKFSIISIANMTELNTYRNEIYPLIAIPDENCGYYTYSEANHYEAYYCAPLPLAPAPVTIINGTVYNKASRKPITNAEVRLMRIGEKDIWGGYLLDVDKKGRFSIPAKRDSRYILSIAAPGYIYYSGNMGPLKKNAQTRMNLGLKQGKLIKGYSFEAPNIYFDTGSAKIRIESRAELHNIYNFLLKNPGIKILICGYTDSRGSSEFNFRLSEKRAASIARYLIKKGIERNRLKTKGFGEQFNAASNRSVKGRQKNRRVKITITNALF